MNKAAKKKFLNLITSNGRLLTTEEAFDFYIENVMRNAVTCKLNLYRPGFQYEDYKLWELQAKADGWYKNAVGSLVISGALKLRSIKCND